MDDNLDDNKGFVSFSFIENLIQGIKSEDEEKREKQLIILTLIKLILMFLIAFFSVIESQWNFLQFITFISEILIIFFFSQFFFKNKFLIFIGYLLSSVLYVLALSNMISLAVTGGFVSYLMWTNIVNINALGASSLLLYIGAGLVILLAFLPQKQNLLKKEGLSSSSIIVALSLGLIISGVFSGQFEKTTTSGWLDLYESHQLAQQRIKEAQMTSAEQEAIYETFEREGFKGAFEGEIDKPNVIVIFTEGLSSEVLDQNNNLGYGLTPNLEKFESEAITFQNYYNHTAATYRGIRGQLFSSQQYLDGTEGGSEEINKKVNTNLVSLQLILNLSGYDTTMINPEPEHEIFQTYLEELGFDQVITGAEEDLVVSGSQKVLTDADNYQLLFDQALKKKEDGKSFFLSTYTYGTHFALDSDVKHEDGNNSIRNKFFAMDQAFGNFWNQFKNSSLYDNTIVVFTSDHAAFADSNYYSLFGEQRNGTVTPVPFIVYYPDASPQVIDAKGRNTLSLTPTILDMLDYENTKNYFLGNSLFTEEISEQQYITTIADERYSTKNYEQGVKDIAEDPEFSKLLEELKDFEKISLNY